MNVSPQDIAVTVTRALAEDIGRGDITAWLIPERTMAHATVISREHAVLCGRAWVDAVFQQLDERIQIVWHSDDGEKIEPNQALCELHGQARTLLSGERTALNFLQTLSGTATQTRAYVDCVQGTRAIILDTRKTIPGLRAAQKYAVTCGGGRNHRMGLYDAILIKENHIAAAGSVTAALNQAHTLAPAGMMVEIEVETLEQLRAALAAGARRILLDNFDLDRLRLAVTENAGRAQLEASGSVSLQNVRAIAETGVDFISVGGLTKHLHAIDLSMRFSSSS